MNLHNIHNPLIYLLSPLFALCFTLGLSSWSQEAEAHKGHAGPEITFMKTKAALKEMLPNGAKIVKRKQPLQEEAIEWAEKTYGIELDDGIYNYYLATDRKNNTVLGAAYVTQVHYRHGDLKLAVGIDANKRITQVAILAINEKYVVDFEGNVGKGLIKNYAGLSLNKLIAKTNELASSNKAAREFSAAVRDAAVLLAAFIK